MKKKVILMLILFFLLTITVLLGLMYMQYRSEQEAAEATPTPIAVVTPTTATTPVAENAPFVLTSDNGVEMVLTEPETNYPDTCTVMVAGEVTGAWYFEAEFPIKLEDKEGNELAAGIATAQADWMTEADVPFEAELSCSDCAGTAATIVLEKSNPSGLAENDDRAMQDIYLPASCN